MGEEMIRTEDGLDEGVPEADLLAAEALESLTGGTAEADARHSKESSRK